jgi:small GTP-binding protein
MAINSNDTVEETRKLIVVGDGMVGKTCLLYAFKGDKFHCSHSPTIFETYAVEIQVDGKTVSIYCICSSNTFYIFIFTASYGSV